MPSPFRLKWLFSTILPLPSFNPLVFLPSSSFLIFFSILTHKYKSKLKSKSRIKTLRWKSKTKFEIRSPNFLYLRKLKGDLPLFLFGPRKNQNSLSLQASLASINGVRFHKWIFSLYVTNIHTTTSMVRWIHPMNGHEYASKGSDIAGNFSTDIKLKNLKFFSL